MRERTPAALEEAAALYRGDLLHGFVLEETEFEEWLMAERERLRELAIEGLANLLRRMRVCRPNESRVPSRLKRPGEQRAAPPIGLPVPEAPLIGRSSELTRLQDLLRQAEEGQERVAIVLGEAGIGKTRLLAEIAGWALDAGSQRPTIPSSRGSLRGFSSCPLQ